MNRQEVRPDVMQDDRSREWVAEAGMREVECVVPDMNGIARGKRWPAEDLLRPESPPTLRMPCSVLFLAFNGRYAMDKERDESAFSDPDVVLRADLGSLRAAPGTDGSVGLLFADPYRPDGSPFAVAPRLVLRRMLDLFEEIGWSFAVAPELEFYLTSAAADPCLPLQPAAGRSGRPEFAPQPYALDGLREYDDVIASIYAEASKSSLSLGAILHESGTAQFEINFRHGDPVLCCDEVLVFKRLVRDVARRHGLLATFMAKPIAGQPGSSMHFHISAVERASGRNLFADATAAPSHSLQNFVGGMQRFLPEMAPLFAPNVNSFRRLRPAQSAPVNLQWGKDNRSCGLRIPASDPRNMRIECRLPGADANPYLALAAALCSGYLGVRDRIEPQPLVDGNAYLHPRSLPRSFDEALQRFATCKEASLFGEQFMQGFLFLKSIELAAFNDVVTPWEREHLQLKI
jgi:glutamine synthetase